MVFALSGGVGAAVEELAGADGVVVAAGELPGAGGVSGTVGAAVPVHPTNASSPNSDPTAHRICFVLPSAPRRRRVAYPNGAGAAVAKDRIGVRTTFRAACRGAFPHDRGWVGLSRE
jgi:hypothetical protein